MTEEKLKTLKEIGFTPHIIPGEAFRSYQHNMRQEAINEIKFAKTDDGLKGVFGGGIDFMFTKDVIGYIKWKNNITKDDLK